MAPDVQQITAFEQKLTALDRRIAQFTQKTSDMEGYFRSFLEQIVSVLGVGGAVWHVARAGQMSCEVHINLGAAGLEEGGRQEPLVAKALGRVVESAGPVVLAGSDGSNVYDGGLGRDGVNRSEHTLLFVPVVEAKKVRSVLLVISPSEVDPRAVRGYLGFLESLCERATVFLQRMRLSELEQHQGRADRLRQYYSALHSRLDPKRTCYALANYGQEFLGVYRCMAGTFNSRGRFRMESVSGLESVAVKSSFIRTISGIARRVCRNDKPLLVEQPHAVLSKTNVSQPASQPQPSTDLISEARVYMLEAKSTVLGVFPIRWDKKVVGAFVVEKATDEPIDTDQCRRIESLLVEAGSALANSLSYRDVPLSWAVRAAQSLRDRIYGLDWGRRAVWSVVLALLVFLPLVVTREVKVVGQAELVPLDARIAYAQQDGVIESVTIAPDRMVRAGARLALMDTRLLEADLDRVDHLINEARIALEVNRKLPATVKLYRSRLKGLQAEREKLLLEKQQYAVKAPVSGMVITQDSEIRQLLSKPVTRGDAILTVVPQDTQWQLTVTVEEDEAGQLLRAYDHLPEGDTLGARVILNAYPDVTFRTEVVSVSPRAYVLSTGEQRYRNVIEVRVAQPAGFREKVDPRQGLEGKVAIECGKRNLYYAVTREFFDFLRVSFF